MARCESESDFSGDEIERFHSDIAEDESEDDGNLYYGVSGPEPYKLSHLQVPENGLFRVQVAGLTASSGRTETSRGAEGRKLTRS